MLYVAFRSLWQRRLRSLLTVLGVAVAVQLYLTLSGIMTSYEADLDRKAEDTQLFQVIRVEADTLRLQAFTATGQLFDAFDLVKQEGRPNRLVDRAPVTSRGTQPSQRR